MASGKAEMELAYNSPDLKHKDFFLSGFLKNNISKGNPHNIAEFKTAITGKI